MPKVEGVTCLSVQASVAEQSLRGRKLAHPGTDWDSQFLHNSPIQNHSPNLTLQNSHLREASRKENQIFSCNYKQHNEYKEKELLDFKKI